MSSFGSSTAATPSSSSPTRYDAQPRSSWVIWRKITRLASHVRHQPAHEPGGLAVVETLLHCQRAPGGEAQRVAHAGADLAGDVPSPLKENGGRRGDVLAVAGELLLHTGHRRLVA